MALEVEVIVEVIVKVIANADSYSQPSGSRLSIDTVVSDVSDDEALRPAGKGLHRVGNTFHSGSVDLLDYGPAWS